MNLLHTVEFSESDAMQFLQEEFPGFSADSWLLEELLLILESPFRFELNFEYELGYERAQKTHIDNIKSLMQSIKPLEVAYRTVDVFFKNIADPTKANNIVFYNAEIDQITDLDNPRFIDFAQNAMEQLYDRLDLRESFSIILIPGYLRSDTVLSKWAHYCYKNKAIIITDIYDFLYVDDIKEFFTAPKHTGDEFYRSSILMTCNYLMVRRRAEEMGEEEDVCIPGSAALAARIYDLPVSEILTSNNFNKIKGVEGVRFDIKMSDLVKFENHGLVTMVNRSGKVLPFSVRTLYNGDNIGLKLYSTVKLFDYFSKVFIDLVNQTAFESWTVKTQQEMMVRMMEILNTMQGHEKIVSGFRIVKFERSGELNNRLLIEIFFELIFNKNYMFSLEADMGFGSYEWSTKYILA